MELCSTANATATATSENHGLGCQSRQNLILNIPFSRSQIFALDALGDFTLLCGLSVSSSRRFLERHLLPYCEFYLAQRVFFELRETGTEADPCVACNLGSSWGNLGPCRR